MESKDMTANTKKLLQYSVLIALNNSLFRDGFIDENTNLNIAKKIGQCFDL